MTELSIQEKRVIKSMTNLETEMTDKYFAKVPKTAVWELTQEELGLYSWLLLKASHIPEFGEQKGVKFYKRSHFVQELTGQKNAAGPLRKKIMGMVDSMINADLVELCEDGWQFTMLFPAISENQAFFKVYYDQQKRIMESSKTMKALGFLGAYAVFRSFVFERFDEINGEGRIVWQSVRTIAQMGSVNKTTMFDRLDRLEELGVIVKMSAYPETDYGYAKNYYADVINHKELAKYVYELRDRGELLKIKS